jgi:hypothetical protein
MKATMRGRDAVSRYLAHKWDLDGLWNWGLTFWDRPEDRSNEESSAIPGHVVVWMIEIGDGVRTLDEFNADLATLVSTPTEVIAHRS